MKKKIMRLSLGLAGLIIVIGIVFCIMRPSYVKEAVSILLGNELNVEQSLESELESE